MPVYSSIKEIIDYTGIEPEQIGKETAEELEEVLLGWLVQAKDLIDADRNRNFHKEVQQGVLDDVPPGINNIAMRMASNMVAIAIFRRDTGVVRLNEFEVKMVKDSVFTSDIEKDLSRYAKGSSGDEDGTAAPSTGTIEVQSQFYKPKTDFMAANGW
jgi:hypothetical protein